MKNKLLTITISIIFLFAIMPLINADECGGGNCGANMSLNVTASLIGENVKVTATYTYKVIDANVESGITSAVLGMKSSTDFFPTFIVLASLIILVVLTIIIIRAIKSSNILQESGA